MLKHPGLRADGAPVTSPYTRARPLPHAGWQRLPRFLAAHRYATAIAALVIGWSGIRGFLHESPLTTGVNGLVALLPPLLAAVFAFQFGWHRSNEPSIRRGWFVVGLGCAIYAISIATGFVMVLIGSEYSKLIANNALASGHGILLSMVTAGTICWLENRRSRLYVGLAIDMFCVAGLATLVMWSLVLHQATLTALLEAVKNGNAQLLMYPIVDITLVAIAVSLLSQVRREGRFPTALVAVAAIGFLSSDTFAILSADQFINTTTLEMSVRNAVSSRSWHDIGWSLGLLALAAGARHGKQETSERLAPLVERSAVWEAVLVLIPFASLVGTALLMPQIAQAGFSCQVLGYGLLALSAIRCFTITMQILSTSRHASIDPLTGVLNHSAFQEQLGTLAKVSIDLREPLTLMMLDIDEFELLNDGFGYQEGDHFLREVAFIIGEKVGSRGVIFRSGGDEFAVVLPGIDCAGAQLIAEDISELCERIETPAGIDPSVSIAMATMPTHTFDASELTRLVSGTLYWSKFNDHSRVTVYDPQIVRILSPEDRMHAIEQLAQLRAVVALAKALDARDPYTARHSQNVARNAVAIAAELGWSPERQELLRIAGLLHDVGKIGVRDTTLRKPGNLTQDEWHEMRQHPVMSARVISGVAPDEIIPWVLAHHERMDGRGYPNGLMAEQIPVEARILAVADSFDAMTASRSYRPGMAAVWAMNEIVECVGTQFDPEVVRAFLQAFKAGTVVFTEDQTAGTPTPPTVVQDPEFGPDKDVAA